LGSWIVPRNQRDVWTTSHFARHDAFWTLVDRGEIIPNPHDTASLARETLGDAVAMRIRPAALAEWLQGPAFLAQVALALFIALGLATYGFASTRRLFHLLLTVDFQTVDPRQNTLIAHGIPMLFALFIGSVLATGTGRWPGGGHGWRYWAFLSFKTISSATLVTLFWIELVAKLHPTYNNPFSVLPALLATFAYVAFFGFTIEWCLSDQRARCPVCLNRLAMPVSVGSWASILEPARTELVCSSGHGSLAITEADTARADQWTNMDNSWKDLFSGASFSLQEASASSSSKTKNP
jgi:hypothetical protein